MVLHPVRNATAKNDDMVTGPELYLGIPHLGMGSCTTPLEEGGDDQKTQGDG